MPRAWRLADEERRHAVVRPRCGIGHRGDRDDRQPQSSTGEQSKVPAGGMPDEHETLGHPACVADREQHVLEGAGPAAAWITDAAVLDVERRDPASRSAVQRCPV